MPMFARRLLYALVAAAALTLLTGSSLVRAQDSFHDVQYLAGHEGYDRKLYGHLVITDTAVIFTKVDARNTPIFSIPIASITDVSVATDRKDASVGSKIMFGFLSRSRKDELVQLTTETSDAAEGLVFKVGKNQSTGVAAKIRFRMKRAGVLAQVADPNATPSGGASNATSPGGELHSDPAVHQNAPENPQRDLPRSARQDPASAPGTSVLTEDADIRNAIEDLKRLHIAQEVREAPAGILVMEIGSAALAPGTPLAFDLQPLYSAYGGTLAPRDHAAIQLWQGDRKIGEYTSSGLLLISH